MAHAPRRHFLNWNQPLLPQAVTWLAGDWPGAAPLDLSNVLVVVPTRQSGRRLREALAEFAARRGSAVFPPQVLTPEALLATGRAEGGRRIATRLELLLAWTEVLRAADLAQLRDVFPVDPPARDFDWALQLADQFIRLQTTLAENDLAITDVESRVGAGWTEVSRWEQLARLEADLARRLASASIRSPFATENGGNSVFGSVERTVVLGVADPLPAALRLLGTLAERVPIDVLVFADPADAARFDPWGRPDPDYWCRLELALGNFEQRVHLCADPRDQASQLARLSAGYDRDGRVGMGLGVADPEIAPLFKTEAARARVAVFNPEGRRCREGSLYHLLSALAACAADPLFPAVEALLGCPDVLAWLSREKGAGFSAARLLAALDTLRLQHLPADLAAARERAGDDLAFALDAIADIRTTLSVGMFPDNVAGVLARLFEGRMLEPECAEDARFAEDARAWTSVVRDCAAAARVFTHLTREDWWGIALRLFGDSTRAEAKPVGAVEMQGWLELLFDDTPHLVVAGLNDGLVPEAVNEDAFLPESLRQRLGLKHNAARFARDAYLLQALVVSRAAHGRLDVLFGRTSAAGDPLRPSRLLLRCPDAELPGRIAFLFRAPDPVDSHLPWRRAWRLRPQQVPPPRQVAVTSLRRWLSCPFRFYLQYALRMQSIAVEKTEMDAFDFGSLCHGALEAMGRDVSMRDCTDAAKLREFLTSELAREARRKFGAELTLPLLIQIESARQRLSRVAEVQARERADGWIIQLVEHPFAVEIGGLVVKGKIDRIDRHLATGAVRVLDYKTSDRAVSPQSAHLRPVGRDEVLPDWRVVQVEGKARAWCDLQLPLYRHALASEWGPDLVCGYVNLPKAVGETALCLWEDYTPDLQERGRACAEAICRAVTAGEFWPPNEDIRPDGDDFAPLFHHGVADSVKWPEPPAIR